jgi:hypothetical protein
MSRPESEFPTLRDLAAIVAELIAEGFGDLPFQIVVAPDSTLQALARHAGATDDDKPAMMIKFGDDDARYAVSFISTERLEHSSKREAIQ